MQIALTHKGQSALWVANGCTSMSKPVTILAGDQSWPLFITLLYLVTEVLCLVILRVWLNKLGVTVGILLISFWNNLSNMCL